MKTRTLGIGGGITVPDGVRRPLLEDPTPGAAATSGTGTAAPPAPPAAPAQQQAAPPADFAPLLQQVRQTVTDSIANSPVIAEVRQQQTALQTRMEQLSQPQRNASGLYGGGAPATMSGETPSQAEGRGYQLFRVLAHRQGLIAADQCKVEIDMHNRLRQLYHAQGFRPEYAQSILVPLGADYIDGMDDGLALEIRQSMQQGIRGADLHELRWLGQRVGAVRQALSQWDDTGLGVFVGPTQVGDLIELLRPKEVFSRAGATNLALPPNGRLQFPRHTGATTGYWINEVPSNASTPTITASEPTTGTLDLVAKKMAVLCKMPNDLLRFANQTVEAFIRNDITRVMALKGDLSMLEGVPTGHGIKGIINYAGIKSRTASTVGANGNLLEPRDLGLMLTDVEEENHDLESQGWTWIMRPQLMEQILERRAGEYDGQSGTVELGPYLFQTNRSDISKGSPMMLRGYPTIRSTQVSRTRTKNSGTDLTYLLGGVFPNWIIGRVGVVEFASSTQGDTAFQTDQTWMRAIMHMDAGPRHETAFAFVDQLLRELP